MRKVFVCSGMGLAKNGKINYEAKKIGKMLASNPNIIYAQGGSTEGLMGLTLMSFIEKSKNVEFYIPDKYLECDLPKLENLLGIGNVNYKATRGEVGRLKEIMKCDDVIVLPGGTGTLEELLFCNENKRSKEFKGNLILVNIDDYFDGFLEFFQKSIDENLAKQSAQKFTVVKSVDEITNLINYNTKNSNMHDF